MIRSITYEETVCSNIKQNFTKANKNKIFLENIYNINFKIPSKNNHSIFLWNNNNNIIYLDKKCNHLFLYNCNNITIHNVDCLTGITIVNCNKCRLLFYIPPHYTIEISNSFDIIFNSLYFSFPISFINCSFTLVKSINYKILSYAKILDNNFFSEWKFEHFNF